MWWIYALLAGFFDATYYASVKKFLKDVDNHVLLGSLFFIASVILFTISFIVGFPELKKGFLFNLLAAGVIQVIAAFLYTKALKLTELSLAVPMISFTPVFLLLTSFLMLGEFPSFYGIIGILIIVTGTYILHSRDHDSLFTPLKHIICDKGVMLMLVVAIIYSLTSNYDKILIQHSDIYFGAASTAGTMAAFFMIYSFSSKGYKNSAKMMIKHMDKALLSGVLFSLGILMTYMAANGNIIPYTISLKRTSAIFSVIYGGYLFREKNIVRKIIATLLMVLGVVFIIVLN